MNKHAKTVGIREREREEREGEGQNDEARVWRPCLPTETEREKPESRTK